MSDEPIVCPLNLMELRPFCDYPGIGRVIVNNDFSPDQFESLRVSLHVFEHKLLAAGYEFYEKVSRPLGQDLLQALLLVWAAELDKEMKKAKAKKK
jgi:hypothetical protein